MKLRMRIIVHEIRAVYKKLVSIRLFEDLNRLAQYYVEGKPTSTTWICTTYLPMQTFLFFLLIYYNHNIKEPQTILLITHATRFV